MSTIRNADINYTELNFLLDRVKAKVFVGKDAAFLAPLMCSMNFHWSQDCKTARTNGLMIEWNPTWFLELSEETRCTVLLHELWHPAMLHNIRCGERNHQIWNIACDIWINNLLALSGYRFDGTYPWMDDDLNQWKHPDAQDIGNYGDTPVEDIYDALEALFCGNTPPPPDGEFDLKEPDGEAAINQVAANVIQANHAAHQAGWESPAVQTVLKNFLAPKVNWEGEVLNWMQDLINADYSWRTRNRRHSEMYLPSLYEDEGRLSHLIYFLDVSGSVSDREVTRFNSEVRYIKETFNPKKLTLVQFDTSITSVTEFKEDEPFEELLVIGRGGTSLVPVRQYIIDHEPTAAIVFSDLECRPMDPLPPEIDVPVLWVGVNARPNSKVNFGKLIHIKE